MLVLLLLCCCVVVRGQTGQVPPAQFKVIKEWKYINFTWPDSDSLRMALTDGDYVPHNVLMAGINYYKDYYYLALPRMKQGVPITLGRVHVNSSPRPLIEPFPSWEMNRLEDCEALQNVQNVAVDSKGSMWIIDGGKTNTLNRNPNVKCDPKLVIYNLETNIVEESYTFPSEVAHKEISFLYDIVVDGDFAYISDNSRIDPGLIVYSRSQKKSWKIKHDSMKADPEDIEFTVDNIRITTPISIAGMGLSPKIHQNGGSMTINDDRVLFFCPLSSTYLYSIKTSFLKDESFNTNGIFTGQVFKVGKKGGQTDGMKMDNKGTLYYGVLPSSSIYKWDSNTSFVSNQKIIARDTKYIQWPNSFAFDDSGNLLVLTNSLQKFIQGRMNIEEPNFRILKGFVNATSYVYEENTSTYVVHQDQTMTIIQNELTTSMTTPISTTITTKIPVAKEEGEDVTITKMTSSTGTLSSLVFCVMSALTLNLLL